MYVRITVHVRVYGVYAYIHEIKVTRQKDPFHLKRKQTNLLSHGGGTLKDTLMRNT